MTEVPPPDTTSRGIPIRWMIFGLISVAAAC